MPNEKAKLFADDTDSFVGYETINVLKDRAHCSINLPN
jgi:hypothetical protein